MLGADPGELQAFGRACGDVVSVEDGRQPARQDHRALGIADPLLRGITPVGPARPEPVTHAELGESLLEFPLL